MALAVDAVGGEAQDGEGDDGQRDERRRVHRGERAERDDGAAAVDEDVQEDDAELHGRSADVLLREDPLARGLADHMAEHEHGEAEEAQAGEEDAQRAGDPAQDPDPAH